jgi:hypothetical protein
MYDTPNRFYAPSPGRWHSPDPLGGDITNPQSWNRYAYALDNPCSLTDPLGLDPTCSFNIAINNSGLLSESQVVQLEQTMNDVFADPDNPDADIGLNFNFTGDADYSVDITTSAAGLPYQQQKDFNDVLGITPYIPDSGYIFNYGLVFVDRAMILATAYPLAVALGYAAAHEAGHYLVHIGDSPQNFGIMAPLGDPNFFPHFSGGNKITLLDRCKSPRKSTSQPSTRGGAGSGWGWTLGGPGGEYSLVGGPNLNFFWLTGGGEGQEAGGAWTMWLYPYATSTIKPCTSDGNGGCL